jgi:hypothetical protein
MRKEREMVARGRRQIADQSKLQIPPSKTSPQSLAKAPIIPWAAGPFTPEGVFALLRDKVMKGDAILPRSTDPAIAHLALMLNMFWWEVKGWTGPWREEQEQLQRVHEAIWTLTEILPAQRKDYAAIPAAIERWNMTAAAEARADLAAFDALVTAAHAARERGLPLALNMMLVMGKPTERWKDFAEDLRVIFGHALPGRPKAAAYRFIMAVTPAITGQHPTFQAVEAPFKKKRFVDRGKRAD